MQVFHTAGVPPNSGSIILPTMGSTRKSNDALQNRVSANTPSMTAGKVHRELVGVVVRCQYKPRATAAVPRASVAPVEPGRVSLSECLLTTGEASTDPGRGGLHPTTPIPVTRTCRSTRDTALHLQHPRPELPAVVVARRHLQRQEQRCPRLRRVEDLVHPQPRRRVAHVGLLVVARL